jgi:hypothetical protein
VVLHYLKKFEGKAIISAENYLSEAEDIKPANEPEVKDVDEKGKLCNLVIHIIMMMMMMTTAMTTVMVMTSCHGQ